MDLERENTEEDDEIFFDLGFFSFVSFFFLLLIYGKKIKNFGRRRKIKRLGWREMEMTKGGKSEKLKSDR